MINFDVLELKGFDNLCSFDVFSDAQNFTEAGKSKKTLDDFLDKIDITTVREKDGGYAFHVRTKPVKKEKDWGKYLPDFGIWKYIFGGKSIKNYFGIDMEGMRGSVVETRTPDGIILDIFANVDIGNQFEILKDSYYSENLVEFEKDDGWLMKGGKIL